MDAEYNKAFPDGYVERITDILHELAEAEWPEPEWFEEMTDKLDDAAAEHLQCDLLMSILPKDMWPNDTQEYHDSLLKHYIDIVRDYGVKVEMEYAKFKGEI